MRAQYPVQRCHPVSPWRIQATERRRGDLDILLHHSTSFILVIVVLWSVRRSFSLTISTPKPELGPVRCPWAARGSGGHKPWQLLRKVTPQSLFESFSWPLTATNVCECRAGQYEEESKIYIYRRSSYNISIYHRFSLGMQDPTSDCLSDLHHTI